MRQATLLKATCFAGLFSLLAYKANIITQKYLRFQGSPTCHGETFFSNNFFKYISNHLTLCKFHLQTTVAKHVRHEKSLDFPAVSICPGYKDLIKDLEWPLLSIKIFDRGINETRAREHFPRTRKEFEDQWNSITYSAGDIFVNKLDNAGIVTRDTLFGKCHTILGTKAITQKSLRQSLKVDLNVPNERSEFKVFVHDRGAVTGFNSLFWTSNMTIYAGTIKKGEHIDYSLSKYIFHYKVGSDIGPDEYHAALNSWLDKSLRNASGMCWMPAFGSVLSDESVDALPL